MHPLRVQRAKGRAAARPAAPLIRVEAAAWAAPYASCSASLSPNRKGNQAYVRRGNVQTAIGGYAGAIADYNEAVKLAPSDPTGWAGKCWSRALAGELPAALSDCNEMVKLRPNDPYALVIRGFARLKAGQFDGAIADYNAALKHDAKNPSALYGRGTAELKKNNPRGNADVAAAKAIKPDIAEEFARYGVK